jgi:hypothetical protein
MSPRTNDGDIQDVGWSHQRVHEHRKGGDEEEVVPAHGTLVEGVRYLREWRKQREQLVVMTSPTRGWRVGLGEEGGVGGGMDVEEVKEASQVVRRMDSVLDVSVGQPLSPLFLGKGWCGYHTQRAPRYG